MANEVMKYFDHSFIIVLTLILMGIGILYQIAIGVIYQKMIQATDTLSGMENKLLVQCKERFVNSYKLNGGVPNIPVFVDKFINRIRVLGMSMSFMKHLSGQLMLAGVFVARLWRVQGHCRGTGIYQFAAVLYYQPFGDLFVSQHCVDRGHAQPQKNVKDKHYRLP